MIPYQVAMVIGEGMDGMLRNAAKAADVFRGQYVDADDNWITGRYGKETKICLEDSPTYENGESQIFGRFREFFDRNCFDDSHVYPYDRITADLLTESSDGKHCVWVNADNCADCFRIFGTDCHLGLNEWETMLSARMTGNGGRETHVPWVFLGQEPPLAPHLRLMSGDHAVEVFWDDISEYDTDPNNGQRDFEAYRVWRVAEWTPPPGATDATEPETSSWTMIAEFDLVDFIPIGMVGNRTEWPVGRNSGLDVARYTPTCLADPQFAGLAEAMQAFVDADSVGRYEVRPPIRSRRGEVIPGREIFVKWEYAPDVLDTFFAVTAREGGRAPKRSTHFYHHRDTEVHNGFQTFYSVVATDRKLVNNGSGYQIAGMGVQSDPSNNSASTTPAPQGQTPEQREQFGNNIYVYPNPATQAALAEFQQRPGTASDPSGVRIMFNNLPAAHNTIRIFTSSGDLIQAISHDGLRDGGAASWNLITRNNQEVVSGIYLYSVHSDDSRFETYRGYFTVVR